MPTKINTSSASSGLEQEHGVLRDQIAEQIRNDILSGFFQPNQRLREETQSARFGVSRGPIRDVFIQLTNEGLLVSHANRGVRVNDLPSAEMQLLMRELRCKIEVFAIEMLAASITQDDLETLEAIQECIEDAIENDDFHAAKTHDLRFHRHILYLAGGKELVNCWTPFVYRMHIDSDHAPRPAVNAAEHHTILDALRLGDASAAAQAVIANITSADTNL